MVGPTCNFMGPTPTLYKAQHGGQVSLQYRPQRPKDEWDRFEEISVNFLTRETSSPEFQVSLVRAGALASKLGCQPNAQVAAEAEKLLCESLEKIETVWLKESGPFLLGNSEPSIADLSLVSQIMQLEVLDEKDIDRILGSRKKIQQWVEDTKNATKPHFEEIHGLLFETKAELQKLRLGADNA
ncbi:hypothetical protein RHMOL_Rhmol02G0284300 [Rhododendron molle]|uniref:Uncharacterized protein n=1 Tax=Rhododendron molle TaxID=49168 RepID=A0ACC0PUT0_RHOML|nr:hypothetical protein RHMOL_Rhmol02G0284300 [Rhododendron molle]